MIFFTRARAVAPGVSASAGRLGLEPRPAPCGPVVESDDTAVLLLTETLPGARWWGWRRMVAGPRALRPLPGLRFAKLMGSGRGGGFGLHPSWSRHGVFAVFDSRTAAADFAFRSPLVQAWRARAAESCVLQLRAYSCRGRWAGHVLEPVCAAPPDGPMAALTRASIRPDRAWSFWRRTPDAEAALWSADGCRLAVGLGEAPLLRQATFSLWDSAAAMDAYARNGPHLQVIREAAAGGWFRESMFVRFRVLSAHGRWRGRDVCAA